MATAWGLLPEPVPIWGLSSPWAFPSLPASPSPTAQSQLVSSCSAQMFQQLYMVSSFEKRFFSEDIFFPKIFSLIFLFSKTFFLFFFFLLFFFFFFFFSSFLNLTIVNHCHGIWDHRDLHRGLSFLHSPPFPKFTDFPYLFFNFAMMGAGFGGFLTQWWGQGVIFISWHCQ